LSTTDIDTEKFDGICENCEAQDCCKITGRRPDGTCIAKWQCACTWTVKGPRPPRGTPVSGRCRIWHDTSITNRHCKKTGLPCRTVVE